ncbi:MAG: LptE family protein [Bacteroidales bacterium]|nr:LptE family protein [Bacteroidales bacterium]
MKRGVTYIILFVYITLLSACGVYSFTGASVSPEVKTVSIDYFPNKAPLIQATLSQTFTDALKDKFISEANLDLMPDNGDLQLSGTIIGYSTKPIAIKGNETAALNRLTITIKVKFINTVDETQNFESSFSRFEDYDSSRDLASVEDVLIGLINEQIVIDIFNRAIINW